MNHSYNYCVQRVMDKVLINTAGVVMGWEFQCKKQSKHVRGFTRFWKSGRTSQEIQNRFNHRKINVTKVKIKVTIQTKNISTLLENKTFSSRQLWCQAINRCRLHQKIALFRCKHKFCGFNCIADFVLHKRAHLAHFVDTLRAIKHLSTDC